MPPKVKVTKESIISAAVDMVRIGGIDVINARSVAQALGVSTQPIFSNYSNMDELRADVLSYAERLYFEHTEREMSKGNVKGQISRLQGKRCGVYWLCKSGRSAFQTAFHARQK